MMREKSTFRLLTLRRIAAAVILTTVLQACDREPAPIDAPDLLITNATIVSGHLENNLAGLDIVIDGGRIVFVGNTLEDQIHPSVQVIDGTGLYLAPGLIDSHTHLSEIPGMRSDQEIAFPEVAAAAWLQIPRSYLYHGFTTVIDLNSQPRYIERWNARDVRPEAFFCGASPVFDGYPMSWMPTPGRYEIMPYFMFDETRADEFPSGYDPADHSPQAVANRISRDGGICVKTHYEKGFGGRGNLPVPTLEIVDALVEAAHSHSLPVLMHANSESSQSFGVQTSVDAFAHGMWTWNDRSLTALHADIEAIVDEAIEKNIALQPTVQVLYGEQDMHNPDYFDDPRLSHVLPASLIDWYATDDGQWWRRRMLEIPIIAQLVEEGRWAELDAPPIARVTESMSYFADKGGYLLFGSDTPSDPTFANPPGLNGRLEMDRWIAAGIGPARIFAAATVHNAEFFGLSEEIGTVETGKQADLLLLRKNPLDDIAAYDTIEYVILDGVAIERSELSALSANRQPVP